MEKKQYNFNISNNHILININNGNYVIDTGSPSSFFYDVDTIMINDKEYRGNRQLVDRQHIEKLVGTTVNGLIGLDIISISGITFDFLNNIITFDVKEGHVCYFLKNDKGYYYTKDCVINNKILETTIIDSGACISYVNKKYLDSSQETDEKYSDYNPSVGDISGNYYEVSIDKVTLGSGSYHHTIKVGRMNDDIEKIALGADAVIGLLDIVKNEDRLAPNKTVSIDTMRNVLYIS